MTSLEKSTFYPPPPPYSHFSVTFANPPPLPTATSLSVTISSSKIPSTTSSDLIGFVNFSIACGATECTIVILVKKIGIAARPVAALYNRDFGSFFLSRLRRDMNL